MKTLRICPFRTRATSVVALRTAVLPEAQTGYGLSVNMEQILAWNFLNPLALRALPLSLRAEGENHRIPPRATFSQPHTLAQLAGSPILLRNTEEQMVAFLASAGLPPLTITL